MSLNLSYIKTTFSWLQGGLKNYFYILMILIVLYLYDPLSGRHTKHAAQETDPGVIDRGGHVFSTRTRQAAPITRTLQSKIWPPNLIIGAEHLSLLKSYTITLLHSFQRNIFYLICENYFIFYFRNSL